MKSVSGRQALRTSGTGPRREREEQGQGDGEEVSSLC